MMWTVNLVIARKAPGVIGPHVLAIGRWAVAGLILSMLARNELWANRRLIVQQAGRYGALGALGMWICGAWVYLAGQSTSVINISLIYASSPVMIGVASVVWLGETFSKRQIAGVAFAILGLVHVVVQGEWAKLANVHLVPGDLWILAAAIAWSAYALLQKIWPTELSSTAQLAAICMGGVIVLFPFALWEYCQAETPALSSDAAMLIGLAATIPGLGAYWIYGWTQKILGASKVAMTLYLGPLYAALVSWGLLGEPLGMHHAVGAVFIISGVALVMAANKR